MKVIFEKPYLIFWLIIPIVIIIGYINFHNVIDVNIHDTYYIINYFHLTIIISLVLGIIGLIYFLSNLFRLNLLKRLTKIHILTFFISLILIFLFNKLYKTNTSYDIISILNDQKFNDKITLTIIILFCLFILSQILFLINIIINIIKKWKKIS